MTLLLTIKAVMRSKTCPRGRELMATSYCPINCPCLDLDARDCDESKQPGEYHVVAIVKATEGLPDPDIPTTVVPA